MWVHGHAGSSNRRPSSSLYTTVQSQELLAAQLASQDGRHGYQVVPGVDFDENLSFDDFPPQSYHQRLAGTSKSTISRSWDVYQLVAQLGAQIDVPARLWWWLWGLRAGWAAEMTIWATPM